MSDIAHPEQGGRDPSLYRPNVGLAIFSRKGHVWLGRRAGVRKDDVRYAWQMPQGGIDPGEDALAAAIRELGEETGVAAHHVELIAQAPEELWYDLPDELIGKVWQGKWRGQRQQWFAFRFLGEDHDIDIASAHQEFRAWRWAVPTELPEIVVGFKRDLYTRLLVLFGPYLND